MKALPILSLAFALCASATTLSCGSGDDCTWTTVFTQSDRSVLSIGGRSQGDIYMVGGGLGIGSGALAMHYNGAGWTEIDINSEETLWWVWADPQSSETWMVGSGGLVVRWDGNTAEVIPTNTDTVFYGVWGSAKDDIWIVGGQPGAGVDPKNDYILHWNGSELTKHEIADPKGAALFKVWGSSANEVWATGERGAIYQFKDGNWSDHSVSTGASLFTVHGCSRSEVYTVGGQELFFYDGQSWQKRDDVDITNIINGVFCGDKEVLIVGMYGQKYRLNRAKNTWSDEQRAPPWDTHFHGAWIAPDNTLWAVGGDYISPNNRDGVVAASGCDLPANLFKE